MDVLIEYRNAITLGDLVDYQLEIDPKAKTFYCILKKNIIQDDEGDVGFDRYIVIASLKQDKLITSRLDPVKVGLFDFSINLNPTDEHVETWYFDCFNDFLEIWMEVQHDKI